MTLIPATITAELLEHADGRPVAYIDATGIAVFACQQPDGTYVDRHLHPRRHRRRAAAAAPGRAAAARYPGRRPGTSGLPYR